MKKTSRRKFIATTGISFFASSFAGAQNKSGVKDGVVGEPFAELEGAKILSEGGNAVDAIITAAATAATTAAATTTYTAGCQASSATTSSDQAVAAVAAAWRSGLQWGTVAAAECHC